MPVLSVNSTAHSTEKLSGGTAHRTRQHSRLNYRTFSKDLSRHQYRLYRMSMAHPSLTDLMLATLEGVWARLHKEPWALGGLVVIAAFMGLFISFFIFVALYSCCCSKEQRKRRN
ncbi:hypothetical protein AOXY_G18494 [Acipenser oxyrinchus oxyrinchus]|uniref:Uncharacterized protein n=1 Tax=Acipenser oxyrinchus oxyrinchus TaxID=40147 RepID=A0AAD8D228_ACIOX|nr:hypothetical protein AOXY_G18494 [Acipenser oxyrinchus oxyrinchus]